MTINLLGSEKTIYHKQVEWSWLSEIITQFAYFDSTKNLLLKKNYQGNIEGLKQELKQINSYLDLLKEEDREWIGHQFTQLPSEAVLEKYITILSKNGSLNFSELNKITTLIELAQVFREEMISVITPEFLLLKTIDFNANFRPFLREFRFLVDKNGDINFDKHPELSQLFKRLREIEDKLRRSVQDWINYPANSKLLQFQSFDVIYDRFVVPIRSDSYRSDLGLIVSRSDSGQTLFVEPFEMRENCNKRLELIAKIDEFINKLEIKFSQSLHSLAPIINSLYETLINIDYFSAKAEFCLKYKLSNPQIKSTPGFQFSGLFHPLINNPVKNSADCKNDDFGIVISGPNTGGKTVFLKSITLSYLLFYHGFFVPASSAEMYPYDGVFYFGNDLQDLNAGLSSFSGEVKNYLNLLDNVLPSNLILIDEIFNSTSSDEASALSLAYFDELHQRGKCHIIVSTHHQMFKTLIHQTHHYQSCHVGFDAEAMKPTYKIIWGTPGSSMAIDIFKILSRNHPNLTSIPAKAFSHLNEKTVSYETLLQKVTQRQIELDKLINHNRQLEIDLKNQKGAMEGVLNLKLNEELNRAKKEIEKIISQAKTVLEQSKNHEITKVKRIDEKSHELLNQISTLRKNEIETPLEEEKTGNLQIQSAKIGDSVFSHIFKKHFIIHSLDLRKNEITIAKGNFKLSVPVHTLSKSNGPNTKQSVYVNVEKSSRSLLEIDARGMRLSEFQNCVDKALGDLLSGDIPYLSVVHGHGDGILKKWLRDYLKKSSDFKGETPENGNDGETKITIK